MKKYIFSAGIVASLILSGCSEERFGADDNGADARTVINLAGQITQEAVSRVNDDGFADGDVMGVYIVDYEGTRPGVLKTDGNRGDNVRFTFNENAYRWDAAYDLFWKDKYTSIDVYGYYPVGSPGDVNNYNFTVRTNQARTYSDGTMGDYEASDFLWGKIEGVAPTSNVIRLPLAHRMANARVTLVQGSGFADGEWSDLDKQILVSNTVQTATIDLATGSVTPAGEVGSASIIPSKRGDEWRAIVVPQTIPAGTVLFNITLGGIPYKFTKNEQFTYVAGKMSNFGIKVDKKEMTGDYTLTLISESITPWESDLVSHDGAAKEYVVIDVATPGTLEKCIADAGKDITKLRNLKLTGRINSADFAVMNYRMSMLAALNLKEVEIVKTGSGMLDEQSVYQSNNADEIPMQAFYGKKTLVSLILPDRLKSIDGNPGGNRGAFADCTNLSGSLIIPEGVEVIGEGAFAGCKNLNGTLSLPSTLKRIGSADGYSGYWDGAFRDCGFTCELVLPEHLEEIGMGTFLNCNGLYGNVHLPDGLKKIGEYAFSGCTDLSGSIEIPQGVTTLPQEVFSGSGFNGTLLLHDGITTIGPGAFRGSHFKGELSLPQNLQVISDNVFSGCDFSGELVIPSSVVTIGENAFSGNWRLMGTLELGEGLMTIGIGAFTDCRSLEGVIFPVSLENIRTNAFAGCYGIGRIVCKSDIPPYVQQGAFDGVPKDNFAVEVPEMSVAQYQTAIRWCDFKRIGAHHELMCRPSVACALGSEHKQILVIDAESDWELESKPDWCDLSQTSGSKKSEITLTIRAMSGNDTREGDIVFRLKDKDYYTHTCHVAQYGYEYGEDEFLTLQRATKGNNGGINIVIMGDGYDAKEIAEGTYLADMRQQIEYFFGIEPYTTYRDYFNVYTAFPVSTETGVGTINTIRYNKFGTTYTGGVGLRCDYDRVFAYAMRASTVDASNINQTLIIIVPNSTDYGGICQMWESGAAIAFCPKSDYGYPLDSRGVIQHEAGGHGFGKLGDEYIYHNAFIDFCGCVCCGHVDAINYGKSLGWYDNLELTGKMHEVGWRHLIFDPRYSDIVDIFEGGYMHSRGVFRSEQNSCMNNDIPYYSTISRESIVKRIKRYAGEEYDFEDFVALDNRAAANASRSRADFVPAVVSDRSFAPVIHKGSPLSAKNKSCK